MSGMLHRWCWMDPSGSRRLKACVPYSSNNTGNLLGRVELGLNCCMSLAFMWLRVFWGGGLPWGHRRTTCIGGRSASIRFHRKCWKQRCSRSRDVRVKLCCWKSCESLSVKELYRYAQSEEIFQLKNVAIIVVHTRETSPILLGLWLPNQSMRSDPLWWPLWMRKELRCCEMHWNFSGKIFRFAFISKCDQKVSGLVAHKNINPYVN